MSENIQRQEGLDGLINDLQVFLELSFQNDEISVEDWVKETVNSLESRCWISKKCDDADCPAYKNECGRCWLIAGTLCGGKTYGKFTEKYGFCTECEVYQDVIGDDPVRQLRELVYALVHSLRLQQKELKEANANLKILRGLLPICSSCKKIRDDRGSWNNLENYIHQNSEAKFSHSICQECAEKLYPELEIYSE